MNSSQLKKAIQSLEETYPFLVERFISRPDTKGRRILSLTEVVNIFNDPRNNQVVLSTFFDSISGDRFRNALKEKGVQFAEYSSIANRHIDLVEIIALHYKHRVSEEVHQKTMEFFEVTRGRYLRQIANDKRSSAPNWTEYGYFLLGLSEKFKDSEPAKADQFKQLAEKRFRKAHDAGYTEATEALATFLYCETAQTDKAIKLWEKAAAAGNETALKNLFEVLCADDSLKVREIKVSLAKADGQALKTLFNTLKSNTDLTPYDAECAVLVSEAIALKEEIEREASQIPTGISYPAWVHADNLPVPA